MSKDKDEQFKFPIELLWEGLVLEENVYDPKGVVLLIPAGEEITEERLERLKNFAGEENYVVSGKKAYERVMSNNQVSAGDDQDDLERKSGYTQLKQQVHHLFEEAKETGKITAQMVELVAERALKQVDEQAISVILNCIDTPRPMDEQLQRHSLNVGLLNGMIAQSLGLSKKETYDAIVVGMLHDVGKTAIPEKVLNAPRKLTEEEFEIMKEHPVFSCELLGSSVDKAIREGVLYHHERTTGDGYPEGLTDDIPLYARITAISDVYDALVQKRCYKEARVPFDVLDEFSGELKEGMDEDLVRNFICLMMKYFRGKTVLMSDGSQGEVFFVPPKDVAHPIIKIGEEIRQADEYWQCKKVIS